MSHHKHYDGEKWKEKMNFWDEDSLEKIEKEEKKENGSNYNNIHKVSDAQAVAHYPLTQTSPQTVFVPRANIPLFFKFFFHIMSIYLYPSGQFRSVVLLLSASSLCSFCPPPCQDSLRSWETEISLALCSAAQELKHWCVTNTIFSESQHIASYQPQWRKNQLCSPWWKCFALP